MSALRGQHGGPCGGPDALFLTCIAFEIPAVIPSYRQRERRASSRCLPVTHSPSNPTAAHLATSAPTALAGVPLPQLSRVPKGGSHLANAAPAPFHSLLHTWGFPRDGHPVHLRLILPAHGGQSLPIHHHLFVFLRPSVARASTCRSSLCQLSLSRLPLPLGCSSHLINEPHLAEAHGEVSTPSLRTTWHRFTDTRNYSLSLKIPSFLFPPPGPLLTSVCVGLSSSSSHLPSAFRPSLLWGDRSQPQAPIYKQLGPPSL